MTRVKIASFRDIVKIMAEILADEWQSRNQEPFVNSSKFPSKMGNMLAEELCSIQNKKLEEGK